MQNALFQSEISLDTLYYYYIIINDVLLCAHKLNAVVCQSGVNFSNNMLVILKHQVIDYKILLCQL